MERKEQDDCFVRLLGGRAATLQPRRRNDVGRLCGNVWSGLENESQEVGSQRQIEKREVQGDVLARIVLQNALSKVTKIYPSLKLMVFVDDITALVKGRNKDVSEMAKKVMKMLKEGVEKKGLKL